MVAEPLVSVIMVVRDGERFLLQALESVAAQRYEPLEVLVVDGHSTDGSARLAADWGARVITQVRPGISEAYNEGVAASRGELVAFLSHDDRWATGKLQRQVAYLAAHPEADYVVGMVEHFLEPGCAVPAGFRRELLGRAEVGQIMETLLARRPLFDRVGPFDPTLGPGEDTDWFARATDLGVKMHCLPDVVVHKRVHDRNTSLAVADTHRAMLLAMKRSIDRKKERRPGP